MACFQGGEGLEEQQQLCAAVEYCAAARDQLGSGASIMLCTAGLDIKTSPFRQVFVKALSFSLSRMRGHACAGICIRPTNRSIRLFAGAGVKCM